MVTLIKVEGSNDFSVLLYRETLIMDSEERFFGWKRCLYQSMTKPLAETFAETNLRSFVQSKS